MEQYDINKIVKEIKDDVIAIQPNGKYAKWCYPLDCVSYFNRDKKDYMKFYLSRVEKKDKKLIEKTIEEKFKNGTITPKEFLEKVKNGKLYLTIIEGYGNKRQIINEKEEIFKVFGENYERN